MAERHALGVGPVELLIAQARAYLGEAVLPVASFEVLPHFAGRVEKGLGDGVQRRGPVPVASIRGQARQAEAAAGATRLLSVSPAQAQARLEHGPRAVQVPLLAPHPAQIYQFVVAFRPDLPLGLSRLLQVRPGRRDIPSDQRVNGGVDMHEGVHELVAGPFGAGDGLSEQWPAQIWFDELVEQQITHQALAQQDVVTEPAGALHRVAPEPKSPSPIELGGKEVSAAQHAEGVDEQTVIVELAGELHRLFTASLGRDYIYGGAERRHGDQRRHEQPGIRPRFGPGQHRQEQAEGFGVTGMGEPVAAERDAEAQDQRGPGRMAGRGAGRGAGRRLGGAPEVGDIGVKPGEPAALIGPGQLRGRSLSDPQEVRAVGRGGRERLVFARLHEPFGGELADGFQQPVAQASAGRLGHHQALVHQRAEKIGDVEHLELARAADRFGGVEIEALGEHRQAAQQLLLEATEQ